MNTLSTMGQSKTVTIIKKLADVRDFGVLAAVIMLGIFFSICAPAFFTAYNILNLLRQTSQLGVIAMAMTILIISGEFDLSVGSLYAVTGVTTGLLFKTMGVNIWIAALLGLAASLVLGLLNGIIVTRTKMHSFIGTLAMMMVYRGVAMVLSQGQPISAFPSLAFFEIMGRGRLFNVIPVPIFWLIGWTIIMFFLLHKTTFGVKIFATGDNREAAELAGIRTDRVKIISFLLTAGAAGLASLISMGFLKTVTPTQGNGIELEAIAASVIGGCSMNGGVGSIIGTFLGALIMAEVRTGLVLMGTDAYIQDAFVGLLIAFAVILNIKLSKK